MFGIIMGAVASAVRAVVASVDALFGRVGLLGNFNAPDGATSYTDAIGNVFTFSGGAAVTSMAQRSGGGNSVRFDGVDDFVTAAVGSGTPLYGSDFCIDVWVRPDSLPAAGNHAGVIAHRETSTSNFSWSISLAGTPGSGLPAGTPTFSFSTSGTSASGIAVNGPSAPNVGAWNHIAVVREADYVTVFVNGVPGAPVSVAGVNLYAASTPIVLGRINSAASGSYFAGQIDGARVTKRRSRFACTFSTPTADYTSATVGYSSAGVLLNAAGADGSTTFVDSGPSAIACSVVGASKIVAISQPFGARAIDFSAGASAVDVAASSALNIGTGDFTIEFYIQTTQSQSSTPWARILCPRLSTNAASGGIQIVLISGDNTITSGGSVALVSSDSNTQYVGTCAPVNDGAWHHVAFVRKDGIASSFLDGRLMQRASLPDSISLLSSEGVRIGGRADGNASAFFVGRMARVAVWRQARHLSSFTPDSSGPAESGVIEAFSGYSNVAAQMNLDGTNNGTVFEDEGPKRKPFTASGTSKISRLMNPPAGVMSSLLLSGSSWIQTTSNLVDFKLGSGSFTVECWFRSSSQNSPVLLDFYGTNVANSWQIQVTPSKVSFYSSTGSLATAVAEGAAALLNGKWHHVAVCRSGATVRLFADGSVIATATDARDFNGVVSVFAVGAQVHSRNPSYDLIGNIGPWRVTPGVSIYTAAFTPPAMFPTR